MTPFTYHRDTWRVFGLRGKVEFMISRRPRGLGLATRKGTGWRTRYVFYLPSLQISRRLNFIGW